jgi:hypothetical protein
MVEMRALDLYSVVLWVVVLLRDQVHLIRRLVAFPKAEVALRWASQSLKQVDLAMIVAFQYSMV